MPVSDSIALIGFMGAGKSCVGVALGDRLHVPFVDTDALIVERVGPIAAVFAERGEAWFREQERTLCVAALDRSLESPCVVALGGGAVTDGDVRAALTRLTHVAWLTAPLPVLFERAFGKAGEDDGAARRPLAQDETMFRRLYDERQPLYRECASVVVANDGTRSVDDIAAELVVAVRRDQRMAGGR